MLASSSPYRKLLLERLGIPFDVCSPQVDETALQNETPASLVSRLSKSKAGAVARLFPEAVVIGSDQVAVCDGAIVGKPGSEAAAVRQLQRFSGRTVHFLTAVCVLHGAPEQAFEKTVATDVVFRALTDDEIRRYIQQDRPLDCAGSFKSEAAGVALLDAMISDDPTAIVGLPLITVCEALRQAGMRVP